MLAILSASKISPARMDIRYLTDTDLPLITDFLHKHPSAAIHQYPVWADTQGFFGAPAVHLGLIENHILLAYAQVFAYRLPMLRLTYWHCPRGPIGDAHAAELLAHAIAHAARESGVLFVRFDFPVGIALPRGLGWIPATRTHFPDTTLVLDLTQPEEELRAQMKQKGRYNIRIAERAGVTVRASTDPHEVDAFCTLLKSTTARDHFTGHPCSYYVSFLQALAPHNQALLYLAAYEGQTIAAALMTYAGDTATYYYGASDYEHRDKMAPYLLQWTAIRDAKRNGYTQYDFLGIAPVDAPASHSLTGVTRFKQQFGGEVITYPPSTEYWTQPHLHAVLERMRHWRRNMRSVKNAILRV